jgi:hypothetical protein
MSEQWLGLHNVHQHQPISQNVAGETTQGWICTESEPCRLCLAAEVEALRAQVQRVREACRAVWPDGSSIAVWRILRALDGDDGDA